MNLYEIAIPQVTRTVTAARAWLDKAQAYADQKKFDPQALLTARLAPDQWHLARQFNTVAVAALRLSAALRGVEAPTFPDVEPTIAAVRERLDAAIEQLRGVKAEDFRGAEDRVVPLPFLPGKGMKAPAYVLNFALPNFYFHATTAYAILRHNGVDVGKLDFIGGLDLVDL